MKKIIIMFLVIALLLPTYARADTYSPNVKISLLRYTPFPAEPGGYVTMTLKIENKGNGDADNVRLKISQEYPFSIDASSAAKLENSAAPLSVDSDGSVSLGKLPSLQYAIVEYKIRVAPDALEGTKQIKIWYQPTPSASWIVETLDIIVQGSDKLEVSNVVPYTITPGKPTNVTFIISNAGTSSVRDLSFTWTENSNKILPLGSGNKKYVESIGPKEIAGIPFVIVADPSAASGVYTLSANITYTIGSNIAKSLKVNIGMFVGGTGDFDASFQDWQAGSISLSVANIGSNPATSVSVKIPDQEGFISTGSPSSFIGNLNPGDFTVVSFNLAPRGMAGSGNQARQTPQNTGGAANPTTLKIEISYTDTNSNRQAVEKEVPVRLQGFASGQMRAGGNSRQQGSGFGLIIFGIVGVVLVIILIKYHRKIRGIIKRARKAHATTGD